MYNESEALLFNEGGGGAATAIEVSGAPGGAAIAASETKPAANAGATRSSSPAATSTTPQVSPNGTAAADRSDALAEEIARFCLAVRTGQAVECGPDRAMDSARACIAANEAAATRTRITI
jgi:hypothetical protein